MKKRILLVLLMIMVLLPININAETITKTYVNGTDVNTRENPSATSVCSSASNAKIVDTLAINTEVTILSEARDACNNLWYKISYNGNRVAYIYATFLTTEKIDVASNDEIEIFIEKMKLEGFPDSYITILVDLYKENPHYQFKALQTNLDFQTAVTNQSYVGKALISGIRDEAQRSVQDGSYNWHTDKWIALDGYSWYAASSQTVAYYLDPRNWLTPSGIFMFEDLTYNKKVQTEAVVQKLLSPTFMNGTMPNTNDTYSKAFMDAAAAHNVSPIHLASRARQEIGNNISIATSGAQFTYGGITYSNLYNFYNIGATSGADNVYKGLVYANGGTTGSNTSYGRPWTTPALSIKGGAEFLSTGYISKGQHTLYLQKYNVNPNGYYDIFTHQYMTNVEAPRSESLSTYTSYKNMNMLNEPFVFVIPVYKNMPNEVSKLTTKTGNPNNVLTQITIDGQAIPNFSIWNSNYEYTVSSNTNEVVFAATKASAKSSISIPNKVTLNNKETLVNIVVTAQNKDVRTYTVKIKKETPTITDPDGNEPDGGNNGDGNIEVPPVTIPSKSIDEVLNSLNLVNNSGYLSSINKNIQTLTNDIRAQNNLITVQITNSVGDVKSSGNFATGDRVKLTLNGTTKSYTSVIRGDIDGDATVTIRDLLKIQKHILKSSTLTNEALYAADINKDGSVTILDLLKVQKHILNVDTIVQ